MVIEEVIKLANSMPGKYSEKEVAEFFHTANVGHWPSENGSLEINMQDGKIVFEVDEKKVDCKNRQLTPSGKIWLLGHFFENFKPQALVDVEIINDINDNVMKGLKKISAKDFKNKITERLSGKSNFIKDPNSRFAFVERVRNNSDGSMVYSYDMTNLDKDDSYKFVLMVPGKRILLYVFEQVGSRVQLAVTTISKRDFEKLRPWQRAYFISNLKFKSKDIINENVNSTQLDAAMLLTADIQEQKIIRELTEKMTSL